MATKEVKLPRIVSALDTNPRPGLKVSAKGILWSDKAKNLLLKLAQELRRNESAKHLSLPYSSLRLAFQTHLPNTSYIHPALGYPWYGPKENNTAYPFIFTSEQASLEAASTALRKWIELEFRPFAERHSLDGGRVHELHKAADEVFVESDRRYGLDISEEPTDRNLALWRNLVLQHVAHRLGGQDLFPGLPPVFRVIRGEASNSVELVSLPLRGWDQQLFSMVATISVETVPYRPRPILRVKAGRRLWLDGPPVSSRKARKTVGGFILRSGSPIALHFRAQRSNDGRLIPPASPGFMRQVLDVISHEDDWLESAVRKGVEGDPFIGLVYHSGSDGRRPPRGTGTGATTTDTYDLWQRVCDLLSADGFPALDLEDVTVQARGRTLDKPSSSLVKLMQQLDREEPTEVEDSGAELMQELQAENRKRMQRAFGDAKPVLTLYAREDELDRLADAVALLLGETVILRPRVLPHDVHGDKNSLPASDKKDPERFDQRVEAWAKDILKNEDALGSHVIVQAAQWYQTDDGFKHDDKVNKDAGRHAHATIGGANVQYLLPPDEKDAANWLHRVQAAVYDLFFGHSALVSETRSIVQKAFSRTTLERGATGDMQERYPASIIGISVAQREVTKGVGMLFTATRVDTETGRSLASIGWCEQCRLRVSAWEPFNDALKRVASLDPASWPDDSLSSELFQTFVRRIVKDACLDNGQPLVLFDFRNAAALWPWLQDSRVGEEVSIGAFSPASGDEWKGARLVRIRHGQAPQIIQPKYEEDENGQRASRHTIEKTVLKISSGPNGANFLITPSYLMREKRGKSVYRSNPGSNQPFAQNYRLPGVVEATVAHIQDGDDPDKIANLIAQLKDGYTHTNDTTALPQPLFFSAKVKDYMCPYNKRQNRN